MERWDILDAEGRTTGRIAVRGQPMVPGEYHLIVHVYLVNDQGHFLIQKRSLKKRLWPGVWDVTGGSVLAGEDSRNGAVREVQEELGIRLEPADLTLAGRLRRSDTFVDVWQAKTHVDIAQMTLQPDEVDEVRYVDRQELLTTLFHQAEFRDESYRCILEQAILGS